MNLRQRLPMRPGLATLAALLVGCSLSESSVSISKSISSPFASSSRSSSPEAAYAEDVRDYTAAYLNSGGRADELLYIEPNSGAASGGHAAVRFGEVTYHFPHAAPGIIRSAKEASESFEYTYRGLGNRPVHVSSIAVSANTYERLRGAFERRHVIEDAQFALLESRRRDRKLLEFLRDAAATRDAAAARERPLEAPPPHDGDPGVELPGAGYFAVGAPAARASGGVRPRDHVRAGAHGHTSDSSHACRDARCYSLLRLLDSRRPDAGFALLVGMARLAALERSVVSGGESP